MQTTLVGRVTARLPLLVAFPGFRWLWLATLISSMGNWFGTLALSIYVYNLTGSATAIAGLMASQAIPSLLLSPLAGVAVDRMRRRHVMLLAQAAAALIWTVIPFTAVLWQIYALAMLARLTTSFYLPAERSLVPDLVGKENALSANATISIVSTFSLVVGPALAGMLIAATSPAWAIWVNAITFVVALLCITRIQGELPRTHALDSSRPGVLSEALAGLRFAVEHRALRLLMLTTFASAFAGAGLMTVELIYVKDLLEGGDRGYGFYYSAAGIGAFLASLTAARVARRFTLPGVYVASVLATGLMFFPFANIPVLWFVILIAVPLTYPWVMAMILVDTMLQRWVDGNVRGRVFALIHAQRNAGQILVAAIVGPLVDLWGPVLIINLAGIIYTLVGLYAVAHVAILRRAEPPVVQEAQA
jgi:MFS family permease